MVALTPTMSVSLLLGLASLVERGLAVILMGVRIGGQSPTLYPSVSLIFGDLRNEKVIPVSSRSSSADMIFSSLGSEPWGTLL